MKAFDLKESLKPYTDGWVAVNKKTKQVVAHAKDFKSIAQKVGKQKNLLLIPASDSYFGFITRANA